MLYSCTYMATVGVRGLRVSGGYSIMAAVVCSATGLNPATLTASADVSDTAD